MFQGNSERNIARLHVYHVLCFPREDNNLEEQLQGDESCRLGRPIPSLCDKT